MEQAPFIYVDRRNLRIPGGESRYLPDFCLIMEDRVVILEVDEWSHYHYTVMVEYMRERRLRGDCNALPVVFIRYNPHTIYLGDYGTKQIIIDDKERHEILREVLKLAIYSPQPLEGTVKVCYSECSRAGRVYQQINDEEAAEFEKSRHIWVFSMVDISALYELRQGLSPSP